MGYTTIYPTGTTTGHAHDEREEVYFVISGEGIMVIGEEQFPIKAGDGFMFRRASIIRRSRPAISRSWCFG